jgi:hypothetical protein
MAFESFLRVHFPFIFHSTLITPSSHVKRSAFVSIFGRASTMSSEKEFIETCKRLIEQKISFPQNGSWKQRDFEYLSDLIVEKTGTRISISTLKRIWKDGDNRLPQVYTLNALAGFAGFESWSAFKQQHSHQAGPGQAEKEVKPGLRMFKKSVYLLFIPILLIGLLAVFYFKPVRKNYNGNEITFKSRKNLKSGVPNTVVFEYDISKIDFDSAFIQHTWDKRLQARINKDNHFQTFIYYYPGNHLAKLIVNDKVLKTENINISTAGWQGIVDGISTDSLPRYISGNDIFKKGQLYISKETLLKKGIDVGDKPFSVNYFNVGDFKKVYGENFIVETGLKNSLEDGALTCQYCQLTIICEQGMISLPFCNPGCTANIHLHVSDVFKTGRQNDLSAFGIDLTTWRNIKLKTVNKVVEVYVDDKKIFQQSFKQQLGRITGFHYKFYGCGAVSTVRLYNEKNELCFADDFNSRP